MQPKREGVMRRIIGRVILAGVAAVGILWAQSGGAFAMDMTVAGDQLILTGHVVDIDARKIEGALNSAPITTVILRNSPGGDTVTGIRVGEMFRQRGLRTAVSGYCYSACSTMFLGGRTRYFTDDYPAELTNVGFHGQYRDGLIDSDSTEQRQLKTWFIRYSDGRADAALVDRWINLPLKEDLIHFYDPALVQRHGASTFLCDGTQPNRGISSCEPIGKTALDLGIVTSLELVHSADSPHLQLTQLR
jgi:hypothetical protein